MIPETLKNVKLLGEFFIHKQHQAIVSWEFDYLEYFKMEQLLVRQISRREPSPPGQESTVSESGKSKGRKASSENSTT